MLGPRLMPADLKCLWSGVVCIDFKADAPSAGREGPSHGLEGDMLHPMLDFTIKQYFHDIWAAHGSGNTTNPGSMYPDFFREVVRRTAGLVAAWQSVGFTHGEHWPGTSQQVWRSPSALFPARRSAAPQPQWRPGKAWGCCMVSGGPADRCVFAQAHLLCFQLSGRWHCSPGGCLAKDGVCA